MRASRDKVKGTVGAWLDKVKGAVRSMAGRTHLVGMGRRERSHCTASKKAAFQNRRDCQIGCSLRNMYRKLLSSPVGLGTAHTSINQSINQPINLSLK